MDKLHKIIIKLPIFTVWYWLFCAIFLVDTDFYINNFKVLDSLDTICVYLMGAHFLFFRRKYTRCPKLYLQCIYIIVLLNFIYEYLNQNTYYILYYAITLTYILLSFWRTQK